MKQVQILVGVSGAGKSTYLKGRGDGSIVSADHFFEKDGTYRFVSDQLGEAHASCLRAFVSALLFKENRIYVDNTNCTLVEISPYYNLARAYGYEVVLVRFRVDPAVAFARNTHGVPARTITAMDRAIGEMWSSVPPFWDVETFDVG
jgi:predicted kinase